MSRLRQLGTVPILRVSVLPISEPWHTLGLGAAMPCLRQLGTRPILGVSTSPVGYLDPDKILVVSCLFH